jgi:hypothetical protein
MNASGPFDSPNLRLLKLGLARRQLSVSFG